MRKPYSPEKNHNPVYFGFIDLAVEKGETTAIPVPTEGAVAYVQIVLKMLREEYVISERKEDGAGLSRIKLLLNVAAKDSRKSTRELYNNGTGS